MGDTGWRTLSQHRNSKWRPRKTLCVLLCPACVRAGRYYVCGGRPNRMGLVFIWPTYRDRLSFSSPDRSASNPAKGGRERGRNGWSLFGLRRRRTPPTLPARDGRGRVRTSARCTQYTMYLGADAHRSITVAFCCWTFFFRADHPTCVSSPPPSSALGV